VDHNTCMSHERLNPTSIMVITDKMEVPMSVVALVQYIQSSSHLFKNTAFCQYQYTRK
jgi:hypothetical protein